MKEIKAQTLDEHESNLTIGDQPVTVGGKYRFVLRPLTWGMFQLASKADDVAGTMLRYSLVASEDIEMKFETVDICGTPCKVATLASVSNLPVPIAGTLAKVVGQISRLEDMSAVQVDFTAAV